MHEELTANIDWLGHDTFRIRGEKTIYIDPWKIQGAPHDGDIVLITHSHYDHLSLEDLAKVTKPGATVVAPKSAADKVDWPQRVLLDPDETAEVDGIPIQTVRAYNTNKDFHPRSQMWVGYIITLGGVRYYHSGDTDVIDEMKDIECDVAMIPVSGTYVMTAAEALEAIRLIQPKVVIPMHWGEIVGSLADAEFLKKEANCTVVIKEIVA